MTKFEITLETQGFKGPLEQLLDLIEHRKMQVNDISLAAVSDEYIKYIENKENIPVPETTSFVLIAATLLLLKSKSLLPTLPTTEIEDEDIIELEQRLKLYTRIRSIANELKSKWKKQMFLGVANKKSTIIRFQPTSDITILKLEQTVRRVLDNVPSFDKVPIARVQTEINLEEIITTLKKRILKSAQSSFNEMTSQTSRVEYIVSFLALLELVRRGTINAHQHSTFSDIQIKSEDIATPIYG